MHAVKPEPDREIPQGQSAHNNFWDFQYMHSEATHMFMWAMSDRGVPRSFRMMQGFGVNTYRLINKDGISHFVKFHFTPTLGVHSLVWDEALKLAGQDPDYHRKDLYEAIDEGVYPKWKFGIQTLPESRQVSWYLEQNRPCVADLFRNRMTSTSTSSTRQKSGPKKMSRSAILESSS